MPVFIPYLLISSILFFLYLGEQGKIKHVSVKGSRWIAYILLWIFIGLRGHVMSDFISYYPYFNETPDLLNLSKYFYEQRFEPGFIIYTTTFKLFCSNYFCWVAFNTLIDLLVLAWFFHRYCKSMILPLIFFIAFNGLLMEFNLYRNMKAIDCFLLSIPYLQQRKALIYFLLNILGFLFHSSSILFLPLYFILNVKFPMVIVWGLFIFSNVIFLGNIKVISNILNNLSFIEALGLYDQVMSYGEKAEEVKLSFGYFERSAAFIIFIIFYPKLLKKNSVSCIFFNSYLIYYCSFLTFYEVSVLVERIPYLFMFSYWVLYPNIITLPNKYSQFIKAGVSLLVILKIISGLNNPASKYENIIISNPNYNARRALYESYVAN